MKKKYDVIGVVGEGAYGIVYKCKNKETGKYVAIKKFKETEDELVQKTMKRELKMLQQLKHPNIVEFQESFTHKGNLFLVFEYCERNLLEVLEESPDGLSPKLIKSFVYQMCKAIAYMHKNNMIHRDIKPENLLIDENLNLKLCDFGFARKVRLNKNNNNVDEMTDYVATRWYRSPELLLSGGIYGPDVDYWAVGCIMGELADGNPMFPGENETDQINCIIKILGNLPEELVNMFYKNPIYEGKKLINISKPETIERRYMEKLGPTAIDFMKGLLQLDPKKRLNSETVFKHRYFAPFMKEEEEKKKKLDEIHNNKLIENNQIKIKTEDKNAININNNILKKPSIETKVINNTTNINIINYNNINNPPNNIIEIHNNNDNESYKNNNSKDKKSNNNVLINNSMVIKVNDNNNNQKEKNPKYGINNEYQNNIKIKQINNKANNINKSINMSNSLYNFPLGNKKSLSVNKFMQLNEHQNMTLLNNFPNLMTVSLSQGKSVKYNKLNDNPKNDLNHNNISTTFYKNITVPKKNPVYNDNNSLDKNLKKNKFNYTPINPNTYLSGYKTFFNKNNQSDKYNYDINTNYFKDELKKYNNSPKHYYNNIIDEKDEFANENSILIKTKGIYNNKSKKKYYDAKMMTKYKEKESNLLWNKIGKSNTKKLNSYGTLYNYGNKNKSNNLELPQLIQIYNKNSINKNLNNHYFGLHNNNKY